jgi:hypothetical protein
VETKYSGQAADSGWEVAEVEGGRMKLKGQGSV